MNEQHFTTFLGATFFALSLIITKPILPNPSPTSPKPEVLGAKTHVDLSPVRTESRFTTKVQTKQVAILRQIIKKDDPTHEIGTDTVLQKGKDGVKTITTTTTYYDGVEYSTDVSTQKTIAPETEILAEGTKIVWHTLDTPNGEIKYWRKLHVWATQYDSHCLGCDSWTAIGLRAGKGVIAVDPSVIRLGSKIYVPGYGPAIAGDTGGAIVGNRIDVGFDDTKTSGWYSHYVDIYLL